MPTETDVKPDSSTAEGGSSSTGGGKHQETTEQKAARLQIENERKQTEIVSLRAERDEGRERLGQLEEIERRYGELTAKQEAERKRLEQSQSNIDDQIDELRKKPEAKPWFTHLEREVAKATKLGANEAVLILAADFLEEQAEELAGKEEFKGLTDEKLLKLIKPFMGQFETKSAIRKTKLAFKAWQEAEAYKREKSEAARKKAEGSMSNEDGGRQARESTAQELFDKKGSLEVSEKAALREKLGIMHRSK